MSELSVFERICQRLDAAGIEYRVSHHEPVYTSEEAARVRGVPISSGAKALICKIGDAFRMFVIPADRKLANRLVRQELGSRKLRFATGDEVLALTGLRPGSIPPFGSLFELPTCCDADLAAEKRINFNAGDHSISISMAFPDYVSAESPQLGRFTQPTE